MLKIAIIAPKDLVDTAKNVVKDMNEDIAVYEGSMNRGIKIAKYLEEEGCDVIIARGGTELLMKKSDLIIPTVALPITPIDIHKSVIEAKSIDINISYVIFNNMVPAIEQYEVISNTNYPKYVVMDENEVKTKINEAYNKEIKVIIGGGIITKFIKETGIKSVVIKTGKEAFVSAILEAKRIAIATRKEKERNEKLKAIVAYSHNGIISINERSNIDNYNLAAEKLLGVKSRDVLGKKIDSVFPEIGIDILSGGEETEIIRVINNNKFLFSKIPIEVNKTIVGNVAIFQDVDRIQELEEKIRRETITIGHCAKYTFEDILGCGEEIKEIIRIGKEYSTVDSTVLIEGETGTGKEIMAQSIHNYSSRAKFPFVAVNCAALPESLLESELFGYAPGAFTGADKKGKRGLFELAHGGTLFLDEISEMNPLLQGRLLRVLQEKQVMRLGDNRLIPIDLRVIAATNKNLEGITKKGDFREDLFYRLNVLKINLVPLRSRKEDIECFLHAFIEIFCKDLGKKPLRLENEVIEYLNSYDWPGNIRELRNFCERLVVMSKKSIIGIKDIRHISNPANKRNKEIDDCVKNSSLIEKTELDAIKTALIKSNGNIGEAIKILGISRTTLWRRMKKYNLVSK